MQNSHENSKISIDSKQPGWIGKFVKNKNLLYGLFVVGILSFLILFQIPSLFFKNSHNSDAVQAEIAFARWKASPENPELFNELHALLQKHPDLQRKFEGLIAQVFIHSKQPKMALPFANMALKRLNEGAPFYARYAEASLLIAQGAHSDALKLAKELKESMNQAGLLSGDIENPAMDSLLYGFNLIRIAFLHKNLGQPKEELITWEEVEKYLDWGKDQPSNAQTKLTEMILDNFREKQIVLPDFIQSRKSILKK